MASDGRPGSGKPPLTARRGGPSSARDRQPQASVPEIPFWGDTISNLQAGLEVEGAGWVRSDSLRLRLYAFGDHLRLANVATGKLVNVSASLSWDALRALLLNELVGERVDISSVDVSLVALHLLPDGERVDSPGEPCRNSLPPLARCQRRAVAS